MKKISLALSVLISVFNSSFNGEDLRSLKTNDDLAKKILYAALTILIVMLVLVLILLAQ